MKRYDSYKDSGVEWIGEIPTEWECIRLGMLGDFSSSGIDKKSKENETSVRMVNYTDLIQSRKYYPIQTGEKEYMRVTTPQSKLEEHQLKKGDMVFIPSSETHEDLGYSSLIDFDEDDIVYSYHILRYKTKKPVFHYYKKYLINHHSVLNQFSSECKGTTRQIIGRDVFNNIRVVLPPLSEQQQIVSFLDTKTSLIDSLIEKTQQKIELLKEKRTSLINEVVTKGLNPNVEMKDSGVEWIGEIPSHWEFLKIKRISNIKRGSSPRPIDDPKYFDDNGEYFWIRISDVTRSGKFLFQTGQKMSELGSSLSHKLNEDEIVMSISGSVGKVFITKTKCCIHDGFVTFQNPKVDKDFLYYLLTNEELYSEDRRLGTQFNINSDIVGNKYIPQPPHSEQQQIVEYLDHQTQKIDKTISIQEKRIELLKEYRQSLISEVVTGKRKVV